MSINKKFLIRGSIFALGVVAIGLLVAAAALKFLLSGPPSGTPPPPPTIIAPRGTLPELAVGLSEYAKYSGQDYVLGGGGFFIRTKVGDIVAVTTAHSLTLGNPDRLLEQVAFGLGDEFVVEMDTLYGNPGKPRFGPNMSVDYVLLQVADDVDPGLILLPDPRGAPQPGERVMLFSGIIEAQSGLRTFSGSVLTLDRYGAWVLMDDSFQPGLMSGSPILSMHTGKVVGMAISAVQNESGLMIGMHLIGSLVDKAEGATSYPELVNYRR